MKPPDKERALIVLADGAQAAFATAVVAERARRGQRWRRAFGAGLGGHIAALATAAAAHEAEQMWQAQAEAGCLLLTSKLASAQTRHGEGEGVVVLPDAWRLQGWLDPAALEAFLTGAGALADRLMAAGASCAVAVEELATGAASWVELAGLTPGDTVAALRAAASFPGGWGPSVVVGEVRALRWGGAEVALRCKPPWGDAHAWDVVCGFPVPTAHRRGDAGSIFELVQRRAEATCAAALTRWLPADQEARVWAPTATAYQAWAGREGAELGIEYPLPWERNAEVLGGLLSFGRAVAAA